MVAVAVVGLLVWRRDRRLWFFGAMTVVSVVCSLGASRTVWLPWQVLAGQPLFENIIPSRFLVVTYLCLAAMLGLVADHARRAVLDRARPDGAGPDGVPDRGPGRWRPLGCRGRGPGRGRRRARAGRRRTWHRPCPW